MNRTLRRVLEFPEHQQLQMFLDDGSDVGNLQKHRRKITSLGASACLMGVTAVTAEKLFAKDINIAVVTGASILGVMGLEISFIPYLNLHRQPNSETSFVPNLIEEQNCVDPLDQCIQLRLIPVEALAC